jgi:cytochrome P450
VKEYFGENPPAIVAMSNLFFPILIINKPEPLEDLYINKNKYVDKEQMPKLQL